MNCRQYERLIALMIEGDLPNADSKHLYEHLASCQACTIFRDELIKSQGALKALQNEKIDLVISDAVHARIIDAIRLEKRHPGKSRNLVRLVQPLSYALAAILIMTGGIWFLRGMASNSQNEASNINIASQTEITAMLEGSHEVTEDDTQLVVEPTESIKPANSVVIKILTDNPNVVIYWLVDNKEKNHVQNYS